MIASSKCRPGKSAGRFRFTIHRTKSVTTAFATEPWRALAVSTSDDAWVFPSERMTPLSKDNWWWRIMRLALEKVGLEWANFQVMRRTHSTLMGPLKADPN